MFRAEIQLKIDQELASGETARSQGLEGRARVCARRAAGVAARAYLAAQGKSIRAASAYDLLAELREDPDLTGEIHQVIDHLMMRVDEQFRLPLDADLLAEARWLVGELSLRSGEDADDQAEKPATW